MTHKPVSALMFCYSAVEVVWCQCSPARWRKYSHRKDDDVNTTCIQEEWGYSNLNGANFLHDFMQGRFLSWFLSADKWTMAGKLLKGCLKCWGVIFFSFWSPPSPMPYYTSLLKVPCENISFIPNEQEWFRVTLIQNIFPISWFMFYM